MKNEQTKNKQLKNEPAKIRDLRYPDGKLTVSAKILFTVIYAWSCFLWGGATIYNFFFLKPEYSHLAKGFLAGVLVMTVGIIMVYYRLFILQLPFFAVGGGIYLRYAGEMIDNAERINVVYKIPFSIRYLPVIAMLVLSVIIAIVQIWRLISIRITEKEEYNNRQSKSILD